MVTKGAYSDDAAMTQIPAEAEIIIGDIVDPDSVQELFNTPLYNEIIVIHCADMVTASSVSNKKLYAVNVTGTKNIIDACVKQKVKKLVYISSTGAIPELPHGEIIREVDSFDPAAVVGGYGKTKAIATQMVLDAVKEHDLDASIVYPSSISGPNDYCNGYFTNFIVDYVNGKIPAGIDGCFNTVDVRDLAEGIIACAEKGRKGEGYIMSSSIVSMRGLFRRISKTTGAREVKRVLSSSAAKVLAALSSFISFLTGKPKLLTSYTLYHISRNNVFSGEKAQQELGFRVRPFEETIRDTAVWLHNDHRICIAGENAGNLNIKVLAA